MNVYILARTPGAKPEDTVEWTSICHAKEKFIYIHHIGFRDTSRWVSVERKRPYGVMIRNPRSICSHEWSWHKTLDGALKAAKALARDLDKPT